MVSLKKSIEKCFLNWHCSTCRADSGKGTQRSTIGTTTVECDYSRKHYEERKYTRSGMYVRASLKTYLFLSFVEDPEFFGGEELKVRSNKKMSF